MEKDASRPLRIIFHYSSPYQIWTCITDVKLSHSRCASCIESCLVEYTPESVHLAGNGGFVIFLIRSCCPNPGLLKSETEAKSSYVLEVVVCPFVTGNLGYVSRNRKGKIERAAGLRSQTDSYLAEPCMAPRALGSFSFPTKDADTGPMTRRKCHETWSNR